MKRGITGGFAVVERALVFVDEKTVERSNLASRVARGKNGLMVTRSVSATTRAVIRPSVPRVLPAVGRQRCVRTSVCDAG